MEVVRPWWLTVSPTRAGLGTGTVAVLSLLLCIHLSPNRVSLRLGDIADTDIVAERTTQYQDTAQTQERRDDASAQVPPQYDLHPEAILVAKDAVGRFYDALDRVLTDDPPVLPVPGLSAPAPATKTWVLPTAKTSVLVQRLREEGLTVSVAEPTLVTLLQESVAFRKRARDASLVLVERKMAQGVTDRPGGLQRAQRETAAFGRTDLPPRLARAAQAVAAASLRPNQIYNHLATERARARVRSNAPVQQSTLPAGEVVLRRGERVTQQHLDKFAALGLQKPRLDAVAVVTVCVLVGLLMALVAVYLGLFHGALYQDTARLLLLALLAVFSVVGLKFGAMLLGLPLSGGQWGYLGMVCIASSGMAIALLLSPQVAVLIVAVLSVGSGLILNHEPRFSLLTLGSSLAGIVSVATLRNRGDLVRAAALVCFANALLIVLVGLLQGDTPRALGVGALWGGLSGLFALVLFWLGVALFEKPFGITTHLRLLELSDPATPVLQEFRMRVPGTYAHSLMVGNLAHAAAEAIGADGLLVRVAAYYHDIGKMNRPEFFVENQATAENVHDRISPTMSALVLTSHVKEGLEIAQAAGLPPRVCDVIQQHHGTSLMRYFYHRATSGVPNPTLETQFRYAGPKPQSKEAAILMLADSVEAASRCLEKPSPSRITDFVAKMVEDKRSDGQLDDCDLTLRDLKKVQTVFVRTLAGTLHARIEYPGPPVAVPSALALAPGARDPFAQETLEEVLVQSDPPPDEAANTHGDNRANRGEGLPAAFGTSTRSRRNRAEGPR